MRHRGGNMEQISLESEEGNTNVNSIAFDVPGSSSTYAVGVNGADAVTGYYTDGAGTHGFLRTPYPGRAGFGRRTIPGPLVTWNPGTHVTEAETPFSAAKITAT
ncbi:MAG TPA: hypothetical protein VHY79_19220 [Rhizomicrobium sp.]|nr:hypothetical protein [Rhizomicrobium sp.]